MPDNKTVTFDEWAAQRMSSDGYPQFSAHDAWYAALAMAQATAPTPAAQSAGQEAVALTDDQWLDLAQRHANADWNSDKPDGFLAAVKALCEDFANIYAAPVNGGERETPLEMHGVSSAIADGGEWVPCNGCYETEDGHPVGHYPYSKNFQSVMGCGCDECGGLGVVWHDSQYWIGMAEMGDGEAEALSCRERFDAWWMDGAYGNRSYDRLDEKGVSDDEAYEIWKAALTSPAKGVVQPAHEQNARFAIDGAISLGMQGVKQPDADHWLAKYWDIGRQLAAKVGGDEQRRFETYLRSIRTQGYGCAKDKEGRYRDGNAQSLWECWCAALSADGGETKVMRARVPPGEQRLTFPLPEGGTVTLTWPEGISSASIATLSEMLVASALHYMAAEDAVIGPMPVRANQAKGDAHD